MLEAFAPEKEIKKIESVETDSAIHETKAPPKESFIGQEYEGLKIVASQQVKSSDSTKEVYVIGFDVTKEKFNKDDNKAEKIRQFLKNLGLTASSSSMLNDVKQLNSLSRDYVMVIDKDTYMEGPNEGYPTINPHKPDGGFLEGKVVSYSEYLILAERIKKTATAEDFLAAQKRIQEGQE